MEAMHRFTLFVVLALTVAHCYGAGQVQMPEAAELLQPEGDLQVQVRELQKNVTDIWNYILELRSAVTHHLTHLRQHQVELESSMHRMEHYHESNPSASSAHHHSDEQHSHSDDYHSHGDEHSHGSDHGHSHSGEQHSHSGEQHSHSGEHHSHSDEHHGHYSHSHSHSSHDHGSDDSHSHGLDHKDSHESEDFQQQTQQVEKPVAEPIVTATNRQEHYHHHHHQSSRSGSTDSLNLLDDHSHHHHHGHHHDSLRSRNKTVELPRVSDYGLYDLATCRMLPNSALPEDQQQNVVGTVTMWQKKSGGPVNFHVRLQGFDVGGHHGHHQQQSIQTEEDNETPQAVVHRHGFHIHASGDLSNGCQSTGPHYNPKGLNHGGPFASTRHVGDLGNIECDEHGNTNILFSDNVVSLRGQYSIIGKAVVIHEQQDDLGLGGNDGSLQHGNAGPRISCCVIEKIEKLPFRQYKLMKTATQYRNQ